MLRKSVLITLISTAALGLASEQASARPGMGSIGGLGAGANHYSPSFRPVFNPSTHTDIGFKPGYLRQPVGTLQIKPNRITPAYVNPNAAAKIKPNYGSTLKPLPVPPIAAATNHPGTGVVTPPASNTTPATPVTPPMHWPHKPGVYGSPVIGAGAIIAATPVIAAAAVEAGPVASVASAPVRAAAAPSAAAAVPATSGPCTCLTKQYTPQGAVVFMDRCTNEVAVMLPQQTGTVAQSQQPQQVQPAN